MDGKSPAFRAIQDSESAESFVSVPQQLLYCHQQPLPIRRAPKPRPNLRDSPAIAAVALKVFG